MYPRNRYPGNGYRSNSMVTGGAATASRISPENSMRVQGAYRSDYRSFNRGGYGRGPPRHFQRPPPQQKHGDVFMEAGRLATEYLVSKGLMPPNVLSGKWQGDSFKDRVASDSMQLQLERRTSALARLGGAANDIAPSRRRYQTDYNSSSSNNMRVGRRSESLRSYSPDLSQESGRSRSSSDRSRSSLRVDSDKDVFSSHHGSHKSSYEGDRVSKGHTPELPPKKDSGGALESTSEKNILVENAGGEESSCSSKKDLPGLGNVELLEKGDVEDSQTEAGEIKDGKDCDVPEEQQIKDYIAVGEAEKVGTISSESGCDLVKLCSFGNVPTRTRSAMASRGSKVDLEVVTIDTDTPQNEPPEESALRVEDKPDDSLPGHDPSVLELDNEVPAREKDLGDADNKLHDDSTASMSEIEKSSAKEQVINTEIHECIIADSSERGEKRPFNDESTKEDNKRPRESIASENSQSEECLRPEDSLEKKPNAEESMTLDDESVLLPSDEKRLLDISVFPKVDIESCIDFAEEKQLFPGSFKTCDLNLMEASDVNENHNKNSILLFPSETESGRQPMSVDIDLSMSNNSCVSNNFGESSIVGKDIEVIDLESEPEQEHRGFDNSERRSENVFTCLDGYSNNIHNGNDISDVQDGYGLMISELLGNDMPNCSSVPADMNSLQGDLGLPSGEGILGDDDSIYMSLGEIPISFLRGWEQPNQEYGKPF